MEHAMKQHFTFSALIVAACLVGSVVPVPAAGPQPLRPLAEMICEQGAPFPTSKLFELFGLEVPFLILTEGWEMVAAPAIQCHNFRPAKAEPFFLVLGHHDEKGTATFFETSLQGDLIQASRGFAKGSGDSTFVAIDPTDEVVAEFEAAKLFWLTTCNDLAINGSASMSERPICWPDMLD
jgi:hypothetical protein